MELQHEEFPLSVHDFESLGYRYIRQLEDGSFAGISKQMYTTSVCLGLMYNGCAKRFFYEHKDDAIDVLTKLVSQNDEPTGWLKRA